MQQRAWNPRSKQFKEQNQRERIENTDLVEVGRGLGHGGDRKEGRGGEVKRIRVQYVYVYPNSPQ